MIRGGRAIRALKDRMSRVRAESRGVAIAAAAVSRLLARSHSDRAVALAHRISDHAPRCTSAEVSYDGVRFVVDLRDNLQRTLFYLGHYERGVHQLLVRELQPGDVFVDVGANVGVHALPIAKRLARVGGSAVAFEPSAASAAVLRRNASRNHVVLDVQEVGLGRGRASLTLHASPRWDSADLGVRSIYGEAEAVESIDVWSFDEWAGQHSLPRVDIVKIDVEGAEYDVLVGMEGVLRRLKPRLIVVEVIEYFLALAGTTSSELDAYLRQLGYVTHGPTVAQIVQGPTDACWPNAVYRYAG